jgi:hypothetical protein
VAQGSGPSVCQRAVGEHPLPDYGSVGFVNRRVRLPASEGDPHAGWLWGLGGQIPRLPNWASALNPSWKATVPCGICPSKDSAKKTSCGTPSCTSPGMVLNPNSL